MKRYNCAIIIATHNGGMFLHDQLGSIQAQVGVDCTIFYSDDSSKDSSREILKAYGARSLSRRGMTFGRASNNFLWAIYNFPDYENFDYVFLADQDDIWLPTKCLSAINKLRVLKKDCYSGSYYRWEPYKCKLVYVNKSYNQNEVDYLFRSPGPGFTYCFSSKAFASVQRAVQSSAIDTSSYMWHDWYLYALARELRLSWFVDSAPYTLYRQHANNETGQALQLTDYFERLRFVLCGKYRAEVLKLPGHTLNCKTSQALHRFNVFDRVYLLSKVHLMRSRFLDRAALVIWLLFSKSDVKRN